MGQVRRTIKGPFRLRHYHSFFARWDRRSFSITWSIVKLWTLEGHLNGVSAVASSPDGDRRGLGIEQWNRQAVQVGKDRKTLDIGSVVRRILISK